MLCMCYRYKSKAPHMLFLFLLYYYHYYYYYSPPNFACTEDVVCIEGRGACLRAVDHGLYKECCEEAVIECSVVTAEKHGAKRYI